MIVAALHNSPAGERAAYNLNQLKAAYKTTTPNHIILTIDPSGRQEMDLVMELVDEHPDAFVHVTWTP